MTKQGLPPLPRKPKAAFHHPIGFELYDGMALDMHAMEYAEPLFKEIAALRAEVAHWKNNHATEVRRARILKERPDMPIERVDAYEKWGQDIEQICRLSAEVERLRSAPSVPAGWQMVPVEPTTAMIVAGVAESTNQSFAKYIYRAMLAAAPAPSQSADAEDAARYRWLRDVAEPADWEMFGYQHDERLDAAIDAARAEGGGDA